MIRAATVLTLGMLALLVAAPIAQAEACPKTSLPAIQDDDRVPIRVCPAA